MLELLAACGGGEGEVLGIDIEIRPHNRKAIEEHPMFKRISMIEGSSIAPEVIAQVLERYGTKSESLSASIPITPMITCWLSLTLMHNSPVWVVIASSLTR